MFILPFFVKMDYWGEDNIVFPFHNHDIPHSENMDVIPADNKTSWLLTEFGILYGIKQAEKCEKDKVLGVRIKFYGNFISIL